MALNESEVYTRTQPEHGHTPNYSNEYTNFNCMFRALENEGEQCWKIEMHFLRLTAAEERLLHFLRTSDSNATTCFNRWTFLCSRPAFTPFPIWRASTVLHARFRCESNRFSFIPPIQPLHSVLRQRNAFSNAIIVLFSHTQSRLAWIHIIQTIFTLYSS